MDRGRAVYSNEGNAAAVAGSTISSGLSEHVSMVRFHSAAVPSGIVSPLRRRYNYENCSTIASAIHSKSASPFLTCPWRTVLPPRPFSEIVVTSSKRRFARCVP